MRAVPKVLNYATSIRDGLAKGLYLGLVVPSSGLQGVTLKVPVATPCMVPYVWLRENGHISRAEWMSVMQILERGSAAEPGEAASLLGLIKTASRELLLQASAEGDPDGYRFCYKEVFEVMERRKTPTA